MRILVISLHILLVACTDRQGHFASAPQGYFANSPQGYFAGAKVTRVTSGGSVFDIRLRGNLAEAIRINPQYAPRLGPLRTRAAQAMAAVSGCRIKAVLGDQALMIGVLDCPSKGG
ncbi:hypothetical protein [Pseudophaeobacter arcticus]|uniref:hypothetical protein n=1 Tax=Pseudophaeobacter arcticus TaxID=385492 RepID=UPI003A96A538